MTEHEKELKKKRCVTRKKTAKKPTKRRVHLTLSRRVPMKFNRKASAQDLKQIRNLCRSAGFKSATPTGVRIIKQIERVERAVVFEALHNVAKRTKDASSKSFSRNHGKKLQEELNVRGLKINLRLHAKKKE